jgi:hypothetical protein
MTDARHCILPELGALLNSYELGALTEPDALRFEEHLVACEFCSAQLEASSMLALDIATHREDVVQELRRTGDSFEAQFQRLKAKKTAPGKFARFFRSAYTRYALAPAVAVGILTFFVVREKLPPVVSTPDRIVELPSSHSMFRLTPPPAPADTALRESVEPPQVLEPLAMKRSQRDEAVVKREVKTVAPDAVPIFEEELDVTSAAEEVAIESAAPSTSDEPLRDTVTVLNSESPAAALSLKSVERRAAGAQETVQDHRATVSKHEAMEISAPAGGDELAEITREFLATQPQPQSSAEALFYRGVSRYAQAVQGGDRQSLMRSADSAFAATEKTPSQPDTLRPWLNLYRAHVAAEIGEDGLALEYLERLNRAEVRFKTLAEPLKSRLIQKMLPAKPK